MTDMLLKDIPEGLLQPLLKAFNEVLKNLRQRRWEPSELNGGKLCEVVYTILKGFVDNSYPDTPSKPRNMVAACRSLEQAGGGFPRSIRILIPRMLIALYEIRNDRGVGHVGGDVDPNHMDALVVVQMSKWIMSELVRVFHDVDVEQATQIVESLIEKELPIVWEIAGRRRVLDHTLPKKDQMFLLLYQHSGPVQEKELVDWVEHSNATVFRKDVIKPAHKKRLIEYNQVEGLVHLSPNGIKYVEDNLPLSIK